jgi:precorrin-6B methylase 2
VVNTVTLENFTELIEFMKAHKYAFEVTTASVARSKELSRKHFMIAANPINIIFGIKT